MYILYALYTNNNYFHCIFSKTESKILLTVDEFYDLSHYCRNVLRNCCHIFFLCTLQKFFHHLHNKETLPLHSHFNYF